MKKKGFTLIELLAVIIVLALIGLIVYPTLSSVISGNKDKLYNKQIEELERHANTWSARNVNKIGKKSVYSLTFEELAEDGLIQSSEIINPKTNQSLPGCILIRNDRRKNKYTFEYSEDCINDGEYSDDSGANTPELYDGLTPIKYENNKWIVVNKQEDAWYNYDKQEWANAVILNKNIGVGQEVKEEDIDLWYVWIPRYKYQLFNANNGEVDEQLINIKFEYETETTGTVTCIPQTSSSGTTSENCTNATNGNWYTHPAFTFGDEELRGIWVGKFELSYQSSKIKIKPNVVSFGGTVSWDFDKIKELENVHNLTNYDSHMIKNIDWGAVTYLSHSKYGQGNNEIYLNNAGVWASNGYTGRSGGAVPGKVKSVKVQYPTSGTTATDFRYGYYTYDGKIVNFDGTIGDYASDRTLGTKASTTGNVYGIYDMCGSQYEYVMGSMVDSDNKFYVGSTGFTTIPDSKYYDLYTHEDDDYLSFSRGKLGDATKEILRDNDYWYGGWHEDSVYMPYEPNSYWLIRGYNYMGGAIAGIFSFSAVDGYSLGSTRAILTVSHKN